MLIKLFRKTRSITIKEKSRLLFSDKAGYYLWALLLLLTVVASCSSAKKDRQGRARNFTYSYCTPTVSEEGAILPDSPSVILPEGRLSGHDELLCRILGIGDLVRQLLKSEADGSDVVPKSLLKQRIAWRIHLAHTQLESVAAELNCEAERANLAAAYLDNLNNGRNRRFTVASVLTGALTAVGTAILSDKNGQKAVGVSGGVLSAGLALAIINPKGRKIIFYHERNLLRSIWEESTMDTDYPFFVWNMLHEKRFSNSGTVTLAESIRSRWMQFEFNGRPDKKDTILLFGKGGEYHADILHQRAAMLDQLQSTVQSMNQDMASLVMALEGI